MQWEISHPDDPTWIARYGHDPERGGVWAELTYNGVRVVFDATEIGFDRDRPVRSVLRFLATFEFVAPDDVNTAFELLHEHCQDGNFQARPNGWPYGTPRAAGRGVRQVFRIVERLWMAGG